MLVFYNKLLNILNILKFDKLNNSQIVFFFKYQQASEHMTKQILNYNKIVIIRIPTDSSCSELYII